jgi:hypothetical protein
MFANTRSSSSPAPPDSVPETCVSIFSTLTTLSASPALVRPSLATPSMVTEIGGW